MKKNLYALSLTAFLMSFVCVMAASARPQARIINGTAQDSPLSWMVSISEVGKDPSKENFCGGVLIAPQWVATAAHCAFAYRDRPTSLMLLIGTTDLKDAQATFVRSAGVLIEPNYDPEGLGFDVALIKLAVPVSHTPLPVITAGEETSLPAPLQTVVYGWGVTDATAEQEQAQLTRPRMLQKGNIQLVSQQECIQRQGNEYEEDQMLCGGLLSTAEGSADGIDSCYGDSGGPLVVETASGPKLIGLVSWGVACASNRYYGVYSRASKFAAWLTNSHSIPPSAREKAKVSGIPEVGKTLSCAAPRFEGDAATSLQYGWKASDSGKIVAKSRRLKVRPSYAGLKVACVVTARNDGGTANVSSRSTAPIAPRKQYRRVRASDKRVKNAQLLCSSASCSLRFVVAHDVKVLRAFNPQSQQWGSADRLTDDVYSLKVRGTSARNPFLLRVMDTQTQESFLISLTT